MSHDNQQFSGIDGFRLTTQDLPRLRHFYQDVLGFAPDPQEQTIAPDEMARLGLTGTGRRLQLRLGRQVLGIDQFSEPGRPYPEDGNAASIGFQHLAIVVGDMAAAYGRVRHTVAITEGGPQQLPVTSGGVQAFKFRDPDGHPLELLQFAAASQPIAWRDRSPVTGQVGLGIDHSAISVSNVEASTRFYLARGLRTGKRTTNHGQSQERLDALKDVEVVVVPLLPPADTPHLELLGYQIPRGAAGPATAANDTAATRIVWRGVGPALVADPDGHLHQIEALPREPLR